MSYRAARATACQTGSRIYKINKDEAAGRRYCRLSDIPGGMRGKGQDGRFMLCIPMKIIVINTEMVSKITNAACDI